VRRIFALSAAGSGYARIAKLLNAEHAPAPRAKGQRPVGWSPSTVKVILDRRLYLGEQVWNRTQKRDSWGQKRWRRRPTTAWLVLPPSCRRLRGECSANDERETSSPITCSPDSRGVGSVAEASA